MAVPRQDERGRALDARPGSGAQWALAGGLSAQILDQVGEGVAAFDRDGLLIYANPAIAQLNGVEVASLHGVHVSAFSDLPEGVTLAEFREQVAALGVVRLERTSRILDGTTKEVQLNLSVLYGARGDIVGHVVCVHDLTERNALRDKLYQAATHDELTGLLNRAELHARLEDEVTRPAQRFTVVFLDLDGFKPVNDEYGHAVGDALLIAVADRLVASVRSQDLVARLGGDEFVLVLRDVESERGLTQVLDRIRAQFDRPFAVDGRSVTVGASCGVAHWSGGNVRNLLQRADKAMYEAKASGGRRVSYAE